MGSMAEAENSVSLDERVLLERVRMFFGLAKGNMAGILIGTILIGVVLQIGGASPIALGVWVGLILISSLAVTGFERHVRTIEVTADNCKSLLKVRIGLGACVAFLWGVAGYLLPSTGTQVQDTYIFIILSTLVTVGTLGYAAMPAYYLIINAVSLVPLSLKFAYQLLTLGDNYYLLLLVLAVTWQIVVMKKAKQVSRTVIDAIEVNERLKDEIEEHKRTKAVLQQMAQQDPLTGLANRSLFSDRLNQTLAMAHRKDLRFAQLYIDLDHFKPVNDKFGHATGDLLLKAVATRIQGCVRESDTVARVGGDEFVVLLREIASAQSALAVAEKIRSSLSESFPIDAHDIQVGCCVGVAIYPDHGRSEIELSARADAAMYEAKEAGGNLVQLASTTEG
jgi:diguanylate cyclase (GGDEF)-like protein